MTYWVSTRIRGPVYRYSLEREGSVSLEAVVLVSPSKGHLNSRKPFRAIVRRILPKPSSSHNVFMGGYYLELGVVRNRRCKIRCIMPHSEEIALAA